MSTPTLHQSPANPPYFPQRPLLLPVLIFVAMVMSVVGTLGTPLVPTIAIDQHVSLETAQWILTVTLLVGAIATPITGRLGDGPHRKWAIVLSLVSVLIGASLSAASVNFAMLIFGRALQGVGLGLVPLTISVARDYIPPAKRRSAIAILSITTAAGAGLGYPITGFIGEHYDYRVGFWLAAVLSLIGVGLVLRFIPHDPQRLSRPLDYPGAITLSAFLLALLLGLSQGNRWGWGTPLIDGLFVSSAIFLLLWIVIELRSDHPLVDLRLMANRPVLIADIVALLMGVGLYAMSSLVNRYVQAPVGAGYGFHAGLLMTGVMLMPLSIGSVASNRISAFFLKRMSIGNVIALGSLFVGLDMLFLAFSRSSRWEIFLSVAILGLGIGMTFATMPAMILGTIPPHETGSAMSMNSVLRTVGGAVGSAASITLLSTHTPSGSHLPTDSGYTVTFLAGAIICFGAAAVSIVFFPRRPKTTILTTSPATPALTKRTADERGIA
jgi:predicted MFS family arabinose efflux permease